MDTPARPLFPCWIITNLRFLAAVNAFAVLRRPGSVPAAAPVMGTAPAGSGTGDGSHQRLSQVVNSTDQLRHRFPAPPTQRCSLPLVLFSRDQGTNKHQQPGLCARRCRGCARCWPGDCCGSDSSSTSQICQKPTDHAPELGTAQPYTPHLHQDVRRSPGMGWKKTSLFSLAAVSQVSAYPPWDGDAV